MSDLLDDVTAAAGLTVFGAAAVAGAIDTRTTAATPMTVATPVTADTPVPDWSPDFDVVPRVTALRAELRTLGLDHVVLADGGAPARAAEAITRTLGVPLTVLDGTDPHGITAALADRLHRTVVVLTSTSLSADSHRRAYLQAFEDNGIHDLGRRFVFVTLPGSPLATTALEMGAQLFLAQPGALSAYALVPAGLAGADIDDLVEQAFALASPPRRNAGPAGFGLPSPTRSPETLATGFAATAPGTAAPGTAAFPVAAAPAGTRSDRFGRSDPALDPHPIAALGAALAAAVAAGRDKLALAADGSGIVGLGEWIAALIDTSPGARPAAPPARTAPAGFSSPTTALPGAAPARAPSTTSADGTAPAGSTPGTSTAGGMSTASSDGTSSSASPAVDTSASANNPAPGASAGGASAGGASAGGTSAGGTSAGGVERVRVVAVVLETPGSWGYEGSDVLSVTTGGALVPGVMPGGGIAPDLAVNGPLGAQLLAWELALTMAGIIGGDSRGSQEGVLRVLDAGLPPQAPAFVDGAVEVHGAVTATTLIGALDEFARQVRPGAALAVHAHLDRITDAAALDVRAGLAGRVDRAVTFTWGGGRFGAAAPDRPATAPGNGSGTVTSGRSAVVATGTPAASSVIQITGAASGDLRVPGRPYTFGELQAAEAADDRQALLDRGRPLLRLHLTDRNSGIDQLLAALGG